VRHPGAPVVLFWRHIDVPGLERLELTVQRDEIIAEEPDLSVTPF
jgi:hypothetical protein